MLLLFECNTSLPIHRYRRLVLPLFRAPHPQGDLLESNPARKEPIHA